MPELTQHRRAHEAAELAEADAREAGQRAEKLELLRDLKASDAWQIVVRPHLLQRLAALQGRLTRDRRMTQEEWRTVQAEAALIDAMVTDPVAFFIADVGQ